MKRLLILLAILGLFIPSIALGVKIADLPALTTVASGDLLIVEDISEAVVADKTKQITWGELVAAPGAIGGTTPAAGTFTVLTMNDDSSLAAAKHLVLPLHNDAVTPTLAIGSTGAGIYAAAANNLYIITSGVLKGIRIDANGNVRGASGLSWGLLDESHSATNPTMVPDMDDTDTGIGRAEADQLSLIAGGVEMMRLVEGTDDYVDFKGHYATSLQNIPDLASRGASYWFDGVDDKVSVNAFSSSAASFVEYSDEVLFRFKAGSARQVLNSFASSSDNDTIFYLSVDTTNELEVLIRQDDGTANIDFDSDMTLIDGQVYHVVFVGTESSDTLYLNGKALALTYGTGSSSTDATFQTGFTFDRFSFGTWDRGAPLYYLGSELFFSRFHNLGLTPTEVSALSSGGEVPFKYVGASQTSIITGTDSDFSGASNWANVNLGGYDETTGGVLTITASGGGGQYCNLPIVNATTEIGKRYRVSFDVANIVSTWKFYEFTGTTLLSGTINSNGTGQTFEFTATTTGGIRLIAFAADSSGEFDNVTLTQIGCVLNLPPEGITDTIWVDASGNDLDGTVSGAIAIHKGIGVNNDDLIQFGLAAGAGQVNITPASAIDGLYINQANNANAIQIVSTASAEYALEAAGKNIIYASQNVSNGKGVYVLRNMNEAGTDPLVTFLSNHTATTQPTQFIDHNGTGGATGYALHVDSENAAGPAALLSGGTADGSSEILTLTDSGDATVFSVDTDGNITLADFTKRIEIAATSNLSHPSNTPDNEVVGTYHALGFDDDTDNALITFEIPSDWNGTSNIDFKFYYTFAANIDDGETYKMDIEYRSRAEDEDLDTGNLTSGTFTETIDTGAGEGTAGRLFESGIVMVYNDGDNPLTAGDIVGISITRDDTADTDADGEILFVQFEVSYTANSISKY